MHFQCIFNFQCPSAEDNMLDRGAHACSSSWGLGGAALHRDMTPSLCLPVVLFPRAGRCEGGDGHQEHFVPAVLQRCLRGGGSSPRAQCTAGTVRDQLAWALPFNQDWGSLKQRKGRAESCSRLILGNLFSKQFFLVG